MTRAFNHSIRTFSKTLVIGTSAAAIVGAVPAAAQEIVVTAQFREQNLQDTPIAITAITGEELANKAADSVVEVANTAPNVTLQQGSSAYGTGVAAYIRGIGQYDTNFALEPGVGMYVDDVYHGVLVGSQFDLLDLDRVEVLRGPQGTLAGKNSIGGAIKLYSRKPEGTGEGYISATYGSYERIDVRGSFDLGITDNLFMRVSAFSKRRDGHVNRVDFACANPTQAGSLPVIDDDNDCILGTLGGIETSGVRAALRALPSDNIEINLIGTLIRDNSQSPATVQTLSSPPADPGLETPYDSRYVTEGSYNFYGTFTVPQAGYVEEPLTETDSASISGQIDIDLADNLKLTSITAYLDLQGNYVLDGDGSPLGIALTTGYQPYDQFTQELRLNGEFGDGMLEYTVGGFYFESSGFVGGRVYSFPALNHIQNDPVDSESKSVFAHIIAHPIENMSITGGIRYTDDKKTYVFSRKDPQTGGTAGPPVGAIDGTSGEYSGSSTDYRLGVDYRFSDALLAYASFSTGYKGGGINPRPFTPGQVQSFQPERVNAYELGFKSDFLDRRVRLNVAGFWNNYSDIILIDANGFPGAPGDPDFFPFSAAPFNAGDAEIKGVEAETTIEPVDGLTLSGSVSYLDFEYTRLDANATASGYTADYVPPFTPKWKWSASLAYEFLLDNEGTITPQIYADFRDDIFTDPDNKAANFIEARTLLNANITYETGNGDWQFVAGVTNLTDEYYLNNIFETSSINGQGQAVVGRPREFYASVRRNF